MPYPCNLHIRYTVTKLAFIFSMMRKHTLLSLSSTYDLFLTMHFFIQTSKLAFLTEIYLKFVGFSAVREVKRSSYHKRFGASLVQTRPRGSSACTAHSVLLELNKGSSFYELTSSNDVHFVIVQGNKRKSQRVIALLTRAEWLVILGDMSAQSPSRPCCRCTLVT